MRWAFWRKDPPAPQAALPEDVGLPQAPRPAPARADADDPDEAPAGHRPSSTASRPEPNAAPSPTYEAPPTAPQPAVEPAALAAAGDDVARFVSSGARDLTPDDPTLAAAATGALAARLPRLSGVDGAVAFDEPADQLLHAYADVLVARAQRRADVDRDDLVAVAHLAAAAAAEDAADEPGLLLLAGVPAATQLRAAALLLAQTADDGGGGVERLSAEVRALFRPRSGR